MTSKSKPWKCAAPNCTQSFKSERRLKEHKQFAEDHEYCHYCDQLFDDYDQLTAHKTSKAAEEIVDVKKWERRVIIRELKQSNDPRLHDMIEREQEKDPKPSIYHLCCKFCGMEFGSLSGRDLHIKQQHPIDQDLHCPGCDDIFPRAAALIHHFETNNCPGISRDKFAGYLQHKAIVARLLANPELIGELESSNFLDIANDPDVGGGVKLPHNVLDDDLSYETLGPSLLPQQPTVPNSMPVNQQNFPELRAANPRSGDVDLLTGMENISIATSTAEGFKLKPLKLVANPLPICEDPAAFMQEIRSGNSDRAMSAWTSSSSSKQLFPDAKPTLVTADWQAVIDAKKKQDHKSNLLLCQFWNPAHRDYNPERFFNPVLEEYRCPFPVCDKGMKTPMELEKHVEDQHKIDRIRCPSCLKLFKSYTALIAHCESASSACRLAKSSKLGQMIDEFSGGFLTAERVARPDNDREIDGTTISYAKFEATTPADFQKEIEDQREVTVVGTDLRNI